MRRSDPNTSVHSSKGKLEVTSKRAHGLRKAAGGLLAEMGCTENEIMSVLGHPDERTTAIYTRSASRRMLAESAMKKMKGFKW